ncbi:MAG: hypothetical protein JKY34_14720 [Kordiimonadaceae bacterium]|nr:hypothetical protein [Kordiimonadaceae bacterium]
MKSRRKEDLTREELGEAFVCALDTIKGDPLHDYWIDMVLALSTDRAKWLFSREEDKPAHH